MKEILKQVMTGVDGLPSSKRLLMLYIGIVIWSFVHVAIYFLIKPFPMDLANTVIMYDFALICLLGGMNVWERNQSEKIDSKKDQPPTP
jgi:hypothetical protein